MVSWMYQPVTGLVTVERLKPTIKALSFTAGFVLLFSLLPTGRVFSNESSPEADVSESSESVLGDGYINGEGIISLALPDGECFLSIKDHLKDEKENYSYSSTCNDIYVKFSQKEGKKIGFNLVDGSKGYKLGFWFKEIEGVTPRLEGNSLSYPVKVEGISATVRFGISEGEIKEDIIFDEKPSEEQLKKLPDTIKIPFDMSSDRLKLVNDEDQKEIYFLDPETDAKVFTVSKLTYLDSEGKEGKISLSLSDDYRTFYINLDSSFLKEASYPVVIDPTVIINTSSTTNATQPSHIS